MFYFVRHGETDYTERGTKIYQGHGTNLAPLSETGIGQIKKAAKDIRLQEANLILCSSYSPVPSLQGRCDRSLKSEVPCGSCLNWR